MKKLDFLNKLSSKKVTAIDSEFWKYLSDNAYPITNGKVRIPISLEPFVIEKKDYIEIQKHLLKVVSAAMKLGEAWFKDKNLQKVVRVNDMERSLIMQSKGEDFIGIIRADLFFSKTPKMVEINTDFPDGFFMHEVTATAILKNFPNIKCSKASSHSRLFNKLIKSTGGDNKKHIFIGYDKKRAFVDEFFLSQKALLEFGFAKISVGTFEELIFKDDMVYFKNEKLDIIRRGAEMFKLRKIEDLIDNLQVAQQRSHVKVINNFKMRLLGHKSMMAAMWDEKFHRYLTTDEVKSIIKLVPETKKLHDVDVNKLDYKDWVLKPSDLAEGEGITIGSAVSHDQWKQAIQEAQKKSHFWILQKKVEIPEAMFNLVIDGSGKVESSLKKYDFNPHIIISNDGIDFGEILVRFSDNSVLNVMKGGGITYCLIN